VAPDFRFRLLTQLGNAEAWDGSPERALTYMEEARSLIGDVSVRQRAAFLSGLSLQYRRAGDLEASIRVGHESLALYRVADAERDETALEVNIAITFIELGNHAKAKTHLRRARALAEQLHDAFLRAGVIEAEARLALAGDELDTAAERAQEAITAADAGGSYMAAVGAYRTLGRVARARGDRDGVEAAFGRAADLLRQHRSGTQLRDLLAEWGDLRAGSGDAAGANELYAEALGRRPSRA
jgi:tetratricopeptide (TPR) repeat protein